MGQAALGMITTGSIGIIYMKAKQTIIYNEIRKSPSYYSKEISYSN
jgi:hypothetical protein